MRPRPAQGPTPAHAGVKTNRTASMLSAGTPSFRSYAAATTSSQSTPRRCPGWPPHSTNSDRPSDQHRGQVPPRHGLRSNNATEPTVRLSAASGPCDPRVPNLLGGSNSDPPTAWACGTDALSQLPSRETLSSSAPVYRSAMTVLASHCSCRAASAGCGPCGGD